MKLAQAEQILVIFTLAAGTALTQTFLDGESATFPCMHGQIVVPQWFDNSNSTVIFNRDGLGNPVKTLPAQSNPKYEHYEVNNSQNLQFDLKIDPVRLTDIGRVTCQDATLISPIETYSIDIEAVTRLILVTCDPCDKTGMETTCTCSCSASEGYPDTLTLNWTIDNNPLDPQPATNSSEDSNRTYMLKSQTKFTMKQNNLNLKCSVRGYHNQAYVETNFVDRVVVERLLSSPICTLIASAPGVCTDVVLNCSCTGFPQPQTFVYTNGTMNVTSGQSIYNYKVETGTDTTFQCYGSNGIEFESKLSDQVLHHCPKTTTPTPMKTEKPASTGVPDNNNGLIIGLSVGVPLGLLLIGGLVYWFFIRKREDGKGNNTVKDSTVDSTNSAPPVYGVVDKSSKKKKSDNTDGNGANAKLAPEQPEYAAVNKPKSQPQAAPRPRSQPPDNNEQMELQYADLDHGNRGRTNEIHQPVDEPTQYAEVKSVIV